MPSPRTPRPVIGPRALVRPQPPKERPAEPGSAGSPWFARQVELATPVVLKLRDGEDLEGVLAWYDRACVRLDLPAGGHRVVQKRAIAYAFAPAMDKA